jgi:hypothetical protein
MNTASPGTKRRAAVYATLVILLCPGYAASRDIQLPLDSDVRRRIQELCEQYPKGAQAFFSEEPSTAAAVLRHGETLFAACSDSGGDVVTWIRSPDSWSSPLNVTKAAPRRKNERWDQPRLVSGPDGNVWLVYRSEVRRRLFLHRWLGEQWGPRIDGPAIHHVDPMVTAEFEEELRPIRDYVVEGSRVHDAIQFRLSSDDPASIERVESIPNTHLTAAPGEGVLFIDARDVAEAAGLVWKPHAASKHPANPVLTQNTAQDAPDAVRIFNRGCVLLEQGKFRMWYTSTEAGDPSSPNRQGSNWQTFMHVCYAESDDGIHWRRPVLGLVEYHGSRRNNIVPEMLRIPTVFRDDREPDPGRRFKSWEIASIPGSSRPQSGHLLTSADGLRWRKEAAPRSYPGVRPWYVEFHNVFRDDRETDPQRRWKAYGSFATGPLRRACDLSTSPDGIHWTGYAENPIIDPLQGVGHCIHDLIVWPEGGHYIGLIQVGDELHNYEWELVASRDGVRFSRVADGVKFIGRSPKGDWDYGGIQASRPIRVGDQWWFYYGAYERPWSKYPQDMEEVFSVKMSCGVARIGVGRYAGFVTRSPTQPGRLITRPITCHFDRELTLSINATAAGDGQVRVAVLDAKTQQALPGFSLEECLPVKSDGISIPVRWRNHQSVAFDKPRAIRLQFDLRGEQCEVFGFIWLEPTGSEGEQ